MLKKQFALMIVSLKIFVSKSIKTEHFAKKTSYVASCKKVRDLDELLK